MNGKGSYRGSHEKPLRELPKWVTKNPVVSDVEICHHPPRPSTIIVTNGVLLGIIQIIHGYFTGSVVTRSGKIKARIIQLDLMIIQKMQ